MFYLAKGGYTLEPVPQIQGIHRASTLKAEISLSSTQALDGTPAWGFGIGV